MEDAASPHTFQDHHGHLREAAHLGVQSLGRAADATDYVVQEAIFDVHAHGHEYGDIPEKHLQHTHTALKYLTLGTTIADKAVNHEGGNIFQNLFKDPSAIPDAIMPALK